MTLTNGGIPGGIGSGFSSLPISGFPIPQGIPGLDALSASTNMLLQTNNDLIVAIHKAISESTQEISRKIESLRDDVRDIKLNQQKNDKILQEESTSWRSHIERLLKEQGERHLHDTDRLQEMLMKLVIGGPAPMQMQQQSNALMPSYLPSSTLPTNRQIAVSPIPLSVNKPAQVPITTSFDTNVSVETKGINFENFNLDAGFNKTSASVTTTTTVSKSLFGNGGLSTGANTTSVSTTIPFGTNTGNTVVEAKGVNLENLNLGTESNKTSAPVTATTTVSKSLFGGGAIIGGSNPTLMPTTTSFESNIGNTIMAAKDFNFKNFNLGLDNQNSASMTTTTTPSKSLFGGSGITSGVNTFASLAQKAAESAGGFLGGGGSTGSKSTQQFGVSPFGGNPKDFKLFQSPQSSLNVSSRSSVRGPDETRHEEEAGSDKDEDNADEYTPDVHYEPVVPLPPEVDVVSGEEGEEVMFVARCKLYRYDRENKENKERGLGDIKILKNPVTKKYRCVMRREKVFKLCANFPIHSELKLRPRDGLPTVYAWACKDFSEDVITGADETFTARFKDATIAKNFFEKMQDAIANS